MITTRFAPSPTGFLHVGGLRTALFSYLFAKANNGRFILRIEDTDLARNNDEATAAILEAFAWTGLQIDGEITYQSKRLDIYKRYIQKLLDEGKAYYCYMSQDELEHLRAEQTARKERPKYDGRYRDFKGTPPPNIQPVVRIKSPEAGQIRFKDGVKGEMVFECADILDDFIIARADGMPTYNFVVVVDDALMGVSDVVRGDDHLSNTPKQIVLYEALGFDVPRFYHLAMINGADGQKYSKRHGAADVMDFKRAGYLPEALLNFLLRLGFSHGDQEVFSMQEAIKLFNFEHVSKSCSRFDPAKLDWLNAHYIKTLPQERIFAACKDLGFDFTSVANSGALYEMLKERAKTLLDLISSAKAILKAPEAYDEAGVAKFCKEANRALFAEFEAEFSQAKCTNAQEFCEGFLERHNAKLKDLAQSLRIALVGSTISPSIYEVMDYLGANECALRFKAFKNYLGN